MNPATILSRPRSRAAVRRKPQPRPAASQRAALGNEPKPDRILQFAWGFAPPLIIGTALNYGFFDLLDRSPETAEGVAERTGCSLRGTRALLNALVGLEFLVRQGERSHLSALLVFEIQKPGSARELVY